MSEFTPEQDEAIRIAHALVDLGAPIFCAFPDSLKGGFQLPNAWPDFRPNHRQVELWRPGRGLAMVTGRVFDVLDVDPRNGGLDGWAELISADCDPRIYGMATTPSGGRHYLIGPTGLAKAPASKVAKGVDLQAGEPHGEGRGFIWIAPTVRESRFGARKGEQVAYQWVTFAGEKPGRSASDPGLDNLVERVRANRAGRRAPVIRSATRPAGAVVTEDDVAAFADLASDWSPAEADRLIAGQCTAVAVAKEGEINNVLGGAARVLGRFVAGGYLTEDTAADMLVSALAAGGVHSDTWNVANRKGWTSATVIGAGLANGAKEPWTVAMASVSESVATVSEPAEVAIPDVPPASGPLPRLNVASAGDMTYWLQNVLGSGPLAGFFLQAGEVVYTRRVDELGYVAPKGKDDENGPAQVAPVSPDALAAKIQYAYQCYKEVDEKGEDGKKTGAKREINAMFPEPAAKRAVNAPESMSMLRPLAGLTHTPMVRADGSILDRPGYDADSRYLFLPGAGVNVRAVPLDPPVEDVVRAVALLDEMTAGFPWDSADDRANYYGLLLTPMLRMVAPPAYKMFGITAHQPGSGKTLLADVARALHGGVLRSEMPDKEYEIKQMATALLVSTSAPIVHVDNVTGVVNSSFLAGLLTATGDLQERELGNNAGMLTFSNDRVWTLTGNNLALGGDLSRRTVLIQIDPNMVDPETREFAIADLKAWVGEHRNELLWALLVLIRHWVATGSVPLARRQSDSYARWEGVVAGILAAAGIEGTFDDQSGKRAAAAGADEEHAEVLARLWRMRAGARWTVAEVLTDGGASLGDIAEMVGESRDWLPSVVLDRLARSEAAGRKSFGHWLRNRDRRWCTDGDGTSYKVCAEGKGHSAQEWRVERI